MVLLRINVELIGEGLHLFLVATLSYLEEMYLLQLALMA